MWMRTLLFVMSPPYRTICNCFHHLSPLRFAGELEGVDVSQLLEARPHDFEKDDDDNFHIDYLTAATNLRSWNYNIKLSARHAVKVTAGRIIPALATTTAMVCGLVDVEFCKLVLGLQNLGNDKFYNSNINLAVGSNAFSVFNPELPAPQVPVVPFATRVCCSRIC